MKLRLYRLGADPEFVFGSPGVSKIINVIPAQTIVATGGAKALNSFIGTDSHPATAELRPPPAHNIYRIMHDMASAVDYLYSYFLRKPRLRRIEMYAQPWCSSPEGHDNQAGEHLGGHIHTSMFVQDPDLAFAYENNLVFNFPGLSIWDPHVLMPLAGDQLSQLGQQLQHRVAHAHDLFTPATYVRTVNWLMLPLERFVQNTELRCQRNSHYGNGDPGDKSVRINVSHPPSNVHERFAGWAYLHYEYRVPSSWLTHPWIAYAYFATMKLTMVNFDRLWVLSKGATLSEMASPDSYKQTLLGRLDQLEQKSIRIPSDCSQLGKAITEITTNREQWARPQQFVIPSAWRKLL